MTQSAAERYLRLGLQLGRHVDGIVDAYFGPPELAAAVDAEPPVDPRALVAAAEALLDELEDGWLRDQVVGLRTYAGVLAGESRSYADEVEGCYGVRPTYTDEAVFTAAHERLEELLPGDGTLAERYAALAELDPRAHRPGRALRWRRSSRRRARGRAAWSSCPPARESSSRSCTTSPGWRSATTSATCAAGSPSTSTSRCRPSSCSCLAIHETYPGHHAERCSKEHLLVRGRGLLEETLVLVPTPQSLVSEGIAELAPSVLLEGEGGAALAAVVHDAGIEFDLAHALAVERAASRAGGRRSTRR